MIKVTIYTDSSHNYTGFRLKGHAGFAEAGRDIVCAAVSILAINTVNSIEEFTNDKFKIKTDEEEGFMDFSFLDVNIISSESKVLMNSLVLGLKGIEENNKQYIQIVFKEV